MFGLFSSAFFKSNFSRKRCSFNVFDTQFTCKTCFIGKPEFSHAEKLKCWFLVWFPWDSHNHAKRIISYLIKHGASGVLNVEFILWKHSSLVHPCAIPGNQSSVWEFTRSMVLAKEVMYRNKVRRLEKEVISREWNCGSWGAGENFAICSYSICLWIDCYVWKSIIELHVKFWELSHVTYSFHPLVESVLVFHSRFQSQLWNLTPKTRGKREERKGMWPLDRCSSSRTAICGSYLLPWKCTKCIHPCGWCRGTKTYFVTKRRYIIEIIVK